MDGESVAHPPTVSNTESSGLAEPKADESRPVTEIKRPLQLLDLPIDILQLIVNEISRTSDLAALARTNSAFYRLAIPQIYSRFDIIWPTPDPSPRHSSGVDALSYGLSTLCVGSTFAQTVNRLIRPNAPPTSKLLETDYAQYTRKFSLGNGPPDWVSEYAVYRESGKMLGTLVAQAVSKMKNLESFTWDMPTGVLSRVFEALASLGHQPDNECKLSSVWVRWHEHMGRYNGHRRSSSIHTPANAVPQGSQVTSIGIVLPPNTVITVNPPVRKYSAIGVEYPTFSVLPPLKSLTVLEIDQVSYLDEMAILIERSRKILQELRVGLSTKVPAQPWALPWDGPSLKQVDNETLCPMMSSIGPRRLGGVLGILVGRIYDIRNRRVLEDVPSNKAESAHKRTEGILKLHTLELDCVALSLHVCRVAFDWSVMTKLTLLECPFSDGLWKMLHRQFRPINNGKGSVQYRLALKSIHTDWTTISLINLIEGALPPNSLEDLLLHERRRTPPLSIDTVFLVIKRNQQSLRRLLIDSTAKVSGGGLAHWRQWALSKPLVMYLTGGRLKNLRELSVSFDYRAWHNFLRRLPNLTKLEALQIRHLANYPGSGYVPHEIAQQVVDIVSLRPEVPLRYIGAGPKLYELTEPSSDEDSDSDDASSVSSSSDEENAQPNGPPGPPLPPGHIPPGPPGPPPPPMMNPFTHHPPPFAAPQGLQIHPNGLHMPAPPPPPPPPAPAPPTIADVLPADIDVNSEFDSAGEETGEETGNNENTGVVAPDGSAGGAEEAGDVAQDGQNGEGNNGNSQNVSATNPPAVATSEPGEEAQTGGIQEAEAGQQPPLAAEQQQATETQNPPPSAAAQTTVVPPAPTPPPPPGTNWGTGTAPATVPADQSSSESSSDSDSDSEDDDKSNPGRAGIRMKLREICFYEDTADIFRAANCRL